MQAATATAPAAAAPAVAPAVVRRTRKANYEWITSELWVSCIMNLLLKDQQSLTKLSSDLFTRFTTDAIVDAMLNVNLICFIFYRKSIWLLFLNKFIIIFHFCRTFVLKDLCF